MIRILQCHFRDPLLDVFIELNFFFIFLFSFKNPYFCFMLLTCLNLLFAAFCVFTGCFRCFRDFHFCVAFLFFSLLYYAKFFKNLNNDFLRLSVFPLFLGFLYPCISSQYFSEFLEFIVNMFSVLWHFISSVFLLISFFFFLLYSIFYQKMFIIIFE